MSYTALFSPRPDDHRRGVGLSEFEEGEGARRNLRVGGHRGRQGHHGAGHHTGHSGSVNDTAPGTGHSRCEVTKEYHPSPHEDIEFELGTIEYISISLVYNYYKYTDITLVLIVLSILVTEYD